MRPGTYHSLILYVLSGILLCFSSISLLHAQQPIGGPYEPDSATVLLMHFDGDLENETDESADGQSFGKTIFTRQSGNSVFGQQLFIDNDSVSETGYSHVRIPDTSGLDLTGSWTIQLWFKLDSLTHSQDDITSAPHILEKPGDPDDSEYVHSNYYIHIYESGVNLINGYYSHSDEEWIGLGDETRIIPKEWYYVTFMRDTSSQKIVQIIHQNASDNTRLPEEKTDSLEQIHYAEYDYGTKGFTGLAATSEQPLFLGLSPQNDTTWSEFHGHIDELRISNVAKYESTITSIESDKRSLPSSIYLNQNYPNPFNPNTNIQFSLPEASNVQLTVYNTLGQKIETLLDQQITAGSHSVTFNASGLPSGIYIYRLKTKGYSQSRKMILFK